jgi:hypothetical protein
MKGGCTCGEIRYELMGSPIIVHACHCTWCQRETGGAFAINAVIETSRVKLLAGSPIEVVTPSLSGRGQIIQRCPACHVAVWSHYPTAGKMAAFVRAGTVDQPHTIQPDVHIFTSSKQAWLALPEGACAVPEFYNPAEVWAPTSLARWAALMTG